jgi:hypothetical protein
MWWAAPIATSIQEKQEVSAPIAPIQETWSMEVATPPAISTQSVSITQDFATPRDFIEKSIANIDVMLGNIDKRHTAKEIEEESYRIEKLRFTDLERNAHTEKIIMDKERDHALHMRNILETELERDTANRNTGSTHVESTLKEIGNEHPIHRHTHKKVEHIAPEAQTA